MWNLRETKADSLSHREPSYRVEWWHPEARDITEGGRESQSMGVKLQGDHGILVCYLLYNRVA